MSRSDLLSRLHQQKPVIAPSMLKCDFGNLQHEIEQLAAGGAGVLHLDVMDGHFVPNLSYGPMVIERIRERTDMVLDAHLMISEPARYLDEYLKAGCDCITFHVEAENDPAPLLEEIRQRGAVAGVAINPDTPVEAIEPLLEACDQVLVMSVQPGFGGQSFLPGSLEKLARLRQVAPSDTLIGIDGGVGPDTIAATAKAGADVFVVGSAIFDRPDYGDAITELADLAKSARLPSSQGNSFSHG